MADVAWKLVAVNLSDLASKGAEPVGILLGHSLGMGDERFLEGLRDVLAHYSVPLLGGDTIRAQGLRTLGLTAIGRATHVPVPSRSGAQPGDALWLSGELGAAMLGFEQPAGAHSEAYHRPKPLVREGRALAPLVTAMMDVSDGLLLDAQRMANASKVTIAIETALVPVAAPERRDECLRWGDDYALLFTLPRGSEPPVKCARIGRVEAASDAPLLVDGNVPVGSLGYQHG